MARKPERAIRELIGKFTNGVTLKRFPTSRKKKTARR